MESKACFVGHSWIELALRFEEFWDDFLSLGFSADSSRGRLRSSHGKVGRTPQNLQSLNDDTTFY